MGDLADLFAAIVAAPSDDRPRLAYATEIERDQPDRAAFIRLQIVQWRRRRASLYDPGDQLKVWSLEERYAAEWAGPIVELARPVPTAPREWSERRQTIGWTFERGFVARLRTDPANVTPELCRRAPIEHLELTGDGPARPALTSPVLAQMRSLHLRGIGLDTGDVLALAAQGHLSTCEYLDLRDNAIDHRGFRALVASPTIRAMPVVLLHGNPDDPHRSDDGLPSWSRWAEREYGPIGWLAIPREQQVPLPY